MKWICPKCFAPLNSRRCNCGFVAAPNSDYAMALPNYVLLNNQYILLHVIGAGGFGVTYKALDMKTRGICAIKEYVPVGVARRVDNGQLIPDCSSKVEIYRHAKNRFMEEAYILQKLNSMPTTATITDCFEENGTAYFVMEYIEGRTVKQELTKAGKIPLPRAMSIVGAVANALERIHTEAKIFHRDISPENIMLASNGTVKLLDFGSAKLVSKQSDQHFTVVLKAGYAPPEQYSSAAAQGTYTDVYALASTFYYMVTGTKIPDAPARINGKTYVPLKSIIGAPAGVSDAVDRALMLNRNERTGSCARFWLELQNGYTANSGVPGGVNVPPPGNSSGIGRQKTAVTGSKKLEEVPRGPVKGMPYLIIRSGTKAYALRLRANTICRVGRSSANEVVLPAVQRISNLHFYCYYDSRSGLYAVKDVSRNGIRINNAALAKERFCNLKPGTVLNVAENACTVQLCVE